MKDIYKNFHTETIEDFKVRLRFEDEFLCPEHIFDDEEDYKHIYNGDVTWLIAIVEVFKCGVQLGYTTLGCVSYQWNKIDDFIKDHFYEMAAEAISKAKTKLEELRAA